MSLSDSISTKEIESNTLDLCSARGWCRFFVHANLESNTLDLSFGYGEEEERNFFFAGGLILLVEMATEEWIWFCCGWVWFCKWLHRVGLFFFSFFLLLFLLSASFFFFVLHVCFLDQYKNFHISLPDSQNQVCETRFCQLKSSSKNSNC